MPSEPIEDEGQGQPTLFARSVLGGKKTAEIGFRTTDELKFVMKRRAAECGMELGEWLERLGAIACFGIDHVASLEVKRTEKVAGLLAGSFHKRDTEQGAAS